MQGLTLARPAAPRKSLKDNNLDRKDRSTKQEHEHYGEGFSDVCHKVCHNVSRVRRHSTAHLRLRE